MSEFLKSYMWFAERCLKLIQAYDNGYKDDASVVKELRVLIQSLKDKL